MFKVRQRLHGKLTRYSTVLVASVAVVATAAACSSSGGGGGKSNKSAPPLQFGICCAWGATWSYNPYTAFFPGVGNDFVYQTLAMQDPPNLTKLIPQLSDKWSIKGDAITAHIRTGAKWQDGTPVTSKDVLDTILLNGTNGNQLWNDITDVTTPSTNEISVTVRKGVPSQQALIDLLTQRPFPASVYGKYVTPTLKQDLISYANQQATDPNATGNTAAKTAIANVFTALAKAAPKTMIGDGPYKLITMNTQQAKLVKSNSYYNASKISVPEVTYVNGQQNEVLYGFLTSGRLDFSNVYLPEPIAQKFTHTANSQVALPPAFEYAMVFNSAKYPLSITKVRQALAYAMPRKDMIDAAYGTTNPGGVIEDHPDGLDPGVEKVWLSKDQINSLNKYPHDTDKATSLLKSAGFKKNGKQWIMPNGKPFTLNMEANNATSDIITSFKAAAASLTDFGIKSEVTAVPGAKQTADEQAGNFEITQGFPNNLNPISEIEAMIGQVQNYTSLGNYKGQKGVGFGPTANVPGQGNVNVPKTIDKQAHSTPPGPQMKKLAWSWAQLINQQLPYLQYGNKVYQFSFTTTHYKNWPGLKDPLWNLIAYNMNGGFVHAQEEGFIQPQ